MTIRDVLNKLLWDPVESSSNYELTYVHRGAPQDMKTISCNLIDTVESSVFTYKNGQEEVIIPFHRILAIQNVKTGQPVWRKRTQE